LGLQVRRATEPLKPNNKIIQKVNKNRLAFETKRDLFEEANGCSHD
jgi:hypothetical protein